jgi:hypothetical protein
MTPDEIDAVVVSWRALARRRIELLDVVAAHLPQSDDWAPRVRAAWILEAVDRCNSCLGQASCLGEVAASMVGTRLVRETSALRIDGWALLVGVELSLPLDPSQRVAWRRAWQLFAELVAGLMLEPFGPGRSAGPPTA